MSPLLPLLIAVPSTLPAQQRMDEDLRAGLPLVAHVHVALADNDHQGIVPVKGRLGEGDNPRHNLYWGALYGVKSYFPRNGWKRIARVSSPRDGVLERLVFEGFVRRNGRRVRVYVVADAWDGRRIEDTMRAFLVHSAGHDTSVIEVGDRRIATGGDAHVVAYLGHNGFMEYEPPPITRPSEDKRPNAAVVLACISKSYFLPLLTQTKTRPILLTTSLMAPEAYTFDAAVRAWFEGASPRVVYQRGADAYCRYQKCARDVGRSMFWAQN